MQYEIMQYVLLCIIAGAFMVLALLEPRKLIMRPMVFWIIGASVWGLIWYTP